jgi:hypothetical protein
VRDKRKRRENQWGLYGAVRAEGVNFSLFWKVEAKNQFPTFFLEVTKMAIDNGKVVITDIKIPFGSMVILMVKWAIATIPALIILSAIGTLTFMIINALLGVSAGTQNDGNFTNFGQEQRGKDKGAPSRSLARS